ncbi:amidohydrolase [Altererythrobacter sp. FM1]|uniref:N-acyl-D-amino-acid deacylase family protein n=1 Tax=Tsuneonella flava TaxID=2055955 RepID=UPI000C80D673|nr:amidohydrolase family protein [Tsuneonella flava]ROT93939.1 amidohydrolase [Altererythrobacter sp. FM1]
MFDLLIKSGTIIDGTTFPRYQADIGIRNGVIEKIGRIEPSEAQKVIDATGKVVAPGHVDCHTHYDAQIHWDPYCSNSGENGVTTVVAGNCGFGFAPCRPQDRERAMLMMENTEQVPYEQMKAELPWTWESFPEWLEHLRSLPKGVNFMMYIPLNPLMVYVMGIDAAKSRSATPDELSQMKQLIREAMDAGAAGIGLSHLQDKNGHTDYDGTPMPTDTMDQQDAIELCRTLGEIGRGTIQVLSYVPGLCDMKQLAADFFDATQRPVILNVALSTAVMKECYRPLLDWVDEQWKQGRQIFVQSFVQRSWNEFNLIDLNLNDGIPEWRAISKLPTVEEKLALIADENHRATMRAKYDPTQLMTGSGAIEDIVLTASGDVPELEPLVGRRLGDIAEERGVHALDVLFDTSIATNGWANFQTTVNSGADVCEAADIMSSPFVLAGSSDGGAHSKFYCGGHWATELLCTLGRDGGFMSLEELHYHFSYQPARVMGLRDRGAVLEGMAADLLIYAIDDIDASGESYEMRFDQPQGDWRRYFVTSGYHMIIVNGEITFVDGVPNDARPGKILPDMGALVDQMMLAAEAAE